MTSDDTFAEELYVHWCKRHHLDPQDTDSMIAYEDEAASWGTEELAYEWETYRSGGLVPDF